jgi:hypothetical protein
MIGSLLIRGMLVGLLAGVLAYGFARVAGEPAIERAIAFEEQQDSAAHGVAATSVHHHHQAPAITRGTQAGIGLLTGLLVFGATAGGLYAMAFALLHRRIGPASPRGFAGWLAGMAFVVLVLSPWLKYPANPPAIGDPATIKLRTGVYFAMLLISVLACALALRMGRRADQRLSGWHAPLISVGAYCAIVASAAALMPSMPTRIPDGFPVDALGQFRLASLGVHLLLWATIGLVFGELAARRPLSALPPMKPGYPATTP